MNFHFLPLFLLRNINWKCLSTFRAISTKKRAELPQKLAFLSQYTKEEENAILRILNECCAEDIARYNVKKTCAVQIEEFRRHFGGFRTLREVLNVKGIGAYSLQHMCNSMLNPSISLQKNGRREKRHKNNFVFPTPEPFVLNNLQNAVGVYVGPQSVSWASIDSSGNLLSWDQVTLDTPPKKIHITNLYQEAMNVRLKLPPGSLYLMDEKYSISIGSVKATTTFLTHHIQFIAMLIAILNIGPGVKYLDSLKTDSLLSHATQRVYFMHFKWISRLFRILVGSEQVSAHSVVQDILSFSVASHFSPINFCPELKESYLSKDNIDKESMSMSLLLTMAFFDLVVRETPESLTAALSKNVV